MQNPVISMPGNASPRILFLSLDSNTRFFSSLQDPRKRKKFCDYLQVTTNNSRFQLIGTINFIIWSFQFESRKWTSLHSYCHYKHTQKKKERKPNQTEASFLFLFLFPILHRFFTDPLLSSESKKSPVATFAQSRATRSKCWTAGLCKRNNWLMTIKRNEWCVPTIDPIETRPRDFPSPFPPDYTRPLALVIKRVRRSVYRSCTRVDKRCRVSITIRWDIKPRINQIYTYKSSSKGSFYRQFL